MCVRGMGQKYPVATPLALLNWLKESHMCKSRMGDGYEWERGTFHRTCPLKHMFISSHMEHLRFSIIKRRPRAGRFSEEPGDFRLRFCVAPGTLHLQYTGFNWVI